jgi:hypothetical protein
VLRIKEEPKTTVTVTGTEERQIMPTMRYGLDLNYPFKRNNKNQTTLQRKIQDVGPVSHTCPENAPSIYFAIDIRLYIVALKVFAIKNDPKRVVREIADIEHLLGLAEIETETAKKYFEKYGQMEKFYDIIGKKGGKQRS